MSDFHELIVLTSPPASGKTYWVSKLSAAQPTIEILVIAPLRALADECRKLWGKSIIIMTPEEWNRKKVFSKIVIFDEFHLYFYWGDTFRPVMWEVFYEISLHANQTFLLTATLSEEMKQQVGFFSTQFDSILWLNYGNQILKNKPHRYIKAPSKNWIINQLETELPRTGVKLIFCKYRQEVFLYEKKLSQLGYSCIRCIGGESKYMAQKINLNPNPDFIISTTVLSHGVNLPEIKKIYFLYKINNLDFWIQMVARGGRRGGQFEVFSLDYPEGLKWHACWNFMIILWLSLKQALSPLSIFVMQSRKSGR